MLPGDPEVDRHLSDDTFVRRVVQFEVAVATAQAQYGVIPVEVVQAIVERLDQSPMDLRRIGLLAERSATPVIAIVDSLREMIGEPYGKFLHHGLTSQDCIDTAFSLMQASVLSVIGPRLALIIGRLSRVAEEHATTPMLARTLGQAAAPITFGWKVCSWLEGLEQAALNLGRVDALLSVQLGGPAGDLAGMGPDAQPILGEVAETLKLQPPRVPWHTERSRMLHIAAAYTQVINACGKIAADVIAMSMPEVGELAPGRDPRQERRGGSSAMPHKRNPAAAVLIRSASYAAPGLLSSIAAAGVHEHERAAGAWQSEWRPLRELAHLAGGASLELVLLEQDLVVHPERMSQNLQRADVGTDVSAAVRRCSEYVERFRAYRAGP